MSDEQKALIRSKKIGIKMEKKFPCICTYCNVSFNAAHKDKKYCSQSCLDKDHYHNGKKGKYQKDKNKKRLLEKSKNICNCELCGINYLDIKTLKDLGSNMYNGNSIFHKDHIIPKSKDGADFEENTRYLCWFCNMSRKDIDSKYDEAIKQASISFWKKIKLLAAKTTND